MDEPRFSTALNLLLFDIDGTLLHSGGAGRAAMERAFETVYGAADAFEGVPMMGRTDPVIVRDALARRGIAWNDAEANKFKEYYFWFLEEEIEKPRPGKQVYPGVVRLLTALGEEKGVAMGLLTGNWRYGGLLKLRHFGLDTFFPFGAFADDSETREHLVPVARDRFEKASGQHVAMENVFVIGDTPFDIQCARPHGARTVAVATGIHKMEELLSHKPDHAFADFQNLDDVLSVFRPG
jgi:phosphoglycolate phosphatase